MGTYHLWRTPGAGDAEYDFLRPRENFKECVKASFRQKVKPC